MQQIADELGLSRVTVSAILNGRARRLGFAEKTIKRVEQYLAKRGYVPSRYATELRSENVKVIGILHFGGLFSHLIDGFNQLIEALTVPGQRLELMVVPRNDFVYGVRELIARRVSDLVWLENGRMGEEYKREEVAGYLSNVRTIIYNYQFGDWPGEKDLIDGGTHLVGVNRSRDMSAMAEFIRKLGHKRIVLPNINVEDKNHARHVGIFRKAGLEVYPCWHGTSGDIYSPSFAEECARLIRKAMAEHRITAAAFHGDETACKTIAELMRMGVNIPRDLTVTGFDGTSCHWPTFPRLTTLSIPVEKMVGKVKEVVGDGSGARKHCVRLELVERETHAPPSA